MSRLTVYTDARPDQPEEITGIAAIKDRLGTIGVSFERWPGTGSVAATAGSDEVMQAFAEPVERLKAEYDFQSADVISVGPDHPDKNAMRQKFLSEHIHSDFEVRFFVAGRGLFYLHPDNSVYAVLCEAGDLISVPANMRHWFDMGGEPSLKVIRLFTTPEGWVAQFTGDPIADRFPRMEQYLAQYMASSGA